MKTITDILTFMKALGLKMSPTVVIVIAFLLSTGVAVGTVLYMRYRAQSGPKKDAGPSVDSAGPPSLGASVRPYQLRNAWLRFLRQLPPLYRRSILNFEQFVVLGPAAAGKTRVIDTYTDWRRKSKEFLGSLPLDSDLQVYLASSAVITELPEWVLNDHGAKSYSALKHLWTPLFRYRAPTVIVVIDPIRLRQSTPDVIKDLGETIRGKINVLSAIRRRPVEVRVVLTHLDELEGYTDFAEFCRSAGISTRVPIAPAPPPATMASSPRDPAPPDARAQLDAWLDATRGHLPRALLTLDSATYRRVVAFMRSAPDVIPPVAQFLTSLLVRDALSPDPICDGVYFAADPPALPNPLRGATESGPGPDPRRKHLVIAGAMAATVVLYLGLAYADQRALYKAAEEKVETYEAAVYGTEHEREARAAVCDFTVRHEEWIVRHPDFFEGARGRMRQKFADNIRNDLLIPKLQHITEKGATEDKNIPLPTRSSLYYLALIHSDRFDRMNILDPRRLHIWAAMTGLEPDLIRDYLKNVDVAYTHEVPFDLGGGQIDKRDSAASWVAFFKSMKDSVADGVVAPDELAGLRGSADWLTEALDRFDNDDITKDILNHIDEAAGLLDPKDTSGDTFPLKRVYLLKYAEFLSNISSSDVWGQRADLREVLQRVDASVLDSSNSQLLHGLVERVAALYGPSEAAAGHDLHEIKVHISGQDFLFDDKKWSAILRDSQAAAYVSQFAHTHEAGTAIFFGPDADDLPPVVWNPTNDGSSMFLGKGTIDGLYTRSAFDKYVREVVLAAAALDKIPERSRDLLDELVRASLRRYGAEYRKQVIRFFQSYHLNAPSSEALRVALAQIVSDSSPFADFLIAVDRATSLELDHPALEPMRDAVADFANWHAIVAGTTGSPELAKYKAILGQLLADLGPAPAVAASVPSAPAIAPSSQQGLDLEKELSPAGQRILASLRGEKGSYGGLVNEWLASVKLPELEQAPFLAPLGQLSAIGRAEIQGIIVRVWSREMLPDLQRIADKFPFNRDGDEDAIPTQVIALFHPQTGRFFDLFHRYIEPLCEPLDTTGYRERRSLRGGLALPQGMLGVINQVDTLSKRLWDATGKPIPLVETITTTPFEHGSDPRMALTLVYMNIGDVSLFNFNQKPTEKTIRVDWSKDSTSQVGVQLTDLDTTENIFPEPTVVEGAFWSFFHVLKKATVASVKFPANAQLYIWGVKNRKDRSDVTRARFVIIGDPWEPFALDKALRAEAARSAPVN